MAFHAQFAAVRPPERGEAPQRPSRTIHLTDCVIGAYHESMQSVRLITVVETRAYLARASRIMSEDERTAVVDLVAADPECGVLIKGTGGVRKVRVALEGRGKSGGARVVYFFHNDEIPVYLLTAFPKNRKASLTSAEKAALKRLTDQLVRAHQRRNHGHQ